MKKIISVLLAILLFAALSVTAFADSGSVGVEPGQTMPDFTVSLTDGSTATLSDLLKENDLVVLNIFTSWCKPCELEFPDMEKVYQANSDRMVILSVSGDQDDTIQMIADYKASHSLTFPMGQAGDALDFLNITGYPTTFFIMHDGMVGFIKVGSFLGEGAFEEKVNTFLSPDFDGNPLASETAINLVLVVLCLIALALTGMLLCTIGRWGLFRKAGKPGWYSLIPGLSSYQEYALCWNGWFGLVAFLCRVGAAAAVFFAKNYSLAVVLVTVEFVFTLLESFRLSKAFGKGAGTGILLALFKQPARFVFGLCKAKYGAPQNGRNDYSPDTLENAPAA